MEDEDDEDVYYNSSSSSDDEEEDEESFDESDYLRREKKRRRRNIEMEDDVSRRRRFYQERTSGTSPRLGLARNSPIPLVDEQYPINRTRSIRRFGNWHQNYYHKMRQLYAMTSVDTLESRIYHAKRRPFEGDEVYRGILYTVTNLRDIKLYNYQLNFIKTILPPLFKYLYRNEWKEQSQEILRRHNYKTVYDEVFFRAERRMGKTLTLSFFCLSVVANVTKERQRAFKVAVFAVTEPNAKMFIDECENNWKQLPISIRGQFDFVRTSIRITLTRKTDSNDVRIIQAYIGNGPVSFFHICEIVIF